MTTTTLRQHMQERHAATPLTRKNSDLERLHARLHREALDHSHENDGSFDPPAKQPFFFTFGVGYNLGRSYVVVEAETESEARATFRECRADLDGMEGRLYAFSYSAAEFGGQAEKYGLTEVPIDAPIWPIG